MWPEIGDENCERRRTQEEERVWKTCSNEKRISFQRRTKREEATFYTKIPQHGFYGLSLFFFIFLWYGCQQDMFFEYFISNQCLLMLLFNIPARKTHPRIVFPKQNSFQLFIFVFLLSACFFMPSFYK